MNVKAASPALMIPDSLTPFREDPTSRREGFQMPVCFCPSNFVARQFVDRLPFPRLSVVLIIPKINVSSSIISPLRSGPFAALQTFDPA